MISLNVRDEGATGDGVTDDYAALQTALIKAAYCGGSLYFPAGVYRHEQPLYRYNIQKPLNIRGDGANVSVLSACGCDGLDLGFIQDELNQQPWGLTMRDVGLRAIGNCGTALNVSYGSPEITNDHARPSVSIRDVVVESTQTGCWGNGVRLEGAWTPTLQSVYISGSDCGGQWNELRGAGVELRGKCINAHLANVKTNFWAVGLMAHTNTEGIFCSNCSMVATKRGVWLKGNPAEWPNRLSTLTWNGGLVEIRAEGVTTGSAAFHLENVWTAQISGMQMLTDTLNGGSIIYGVIAQDCRGVNVSGCAVDAFNIGLCATGGSPDFRNVGNTFTNTQTETVAWA